MPPKSKSQWELTREILASVISRDIVPPVSRKTTTVQRTCSSRPRLRNGAVGGPRVTSRVMAAEDSFSRTYIPTSKYVLSPGGCICLYLNKMENFNLENTVLFESTQPSSDTIDGGHELARWVSPVTTGKSSSPQYILYIFSVIKMNYGGTDWWCSRAVVWRPLA